METVFTLIAVLPEIISASIAVAAFATAAYQSFKRRDLAQGLEMSEQTVRGLVATISLLPDTPETKRLKSTVQDMSMALGVENARLRPVVAEVEKLLAEAGILTTGDDTGSWLRASQAVKAWREKRA